MMMLVVSSQTTKLANARDAKIPPVETLTVSMTARTPSSAAMAHSHPYQGNRVLRTQSGSC